ncbi:flagellar FlbD family protein [Nesterenkonia sp. NBAIMH1]|uniref:flagellar FlbD family protein n=1 Tax=Nesterenkonia sp. NBAIMH1 TaxID=2600320 RepID=UPI0011B803B8|nr:flagellar FlbD family protein [Nesterenkonia sp. NBAIMH1]
MIVVTRLNRSRFAVNPDLVERIEEHPDTVLLMVNGERYVVTESMKDVIRLVVEHRAAVVAVAAAVSAGAGSEGAA